MSYEVPRGTTGGTVERELFGRAIVIAPNVPYLDYGAAFQYAREHQPEGTDPTDPKNEFAADVMVRVEKILDADDGEVSFYTAVGTPLDRYHGIDGWFEYRGNIVTIDITTNPNKETYKADIVFCVPGDGLDPSVDEQQFTDHANRLAQEVADRFIAEQPAHTSAH